MIQKIKQKLFLISAFLVMAAPLVLVSGVSAQYDPSNKICTGSNVIEVTPQNAAGGECEAARAATESQPTRLTRLAINLFSVIVGIIAVIMIIYGGFRYVTSGGSSDKITSAKNAILYAIIGLVIVAIAQVIVRYVLGTASNQTV